MRTLTQSPLGKGVAITIALAMAILGGALYLRTLAGTGNTITAAGCHQIGGTLSSQANTCTKNGVMFEVVQ